MSKNLSQAEFIMAHFKKHPNQALALDDWSDEVSRQYKERTGRTAYHLRTIVRRLYWDGKLERVKRGVYKYDPDAVHKPRTLCFTPKQKREILERDEYRCVVCGRGRAEGVELQVDHIKPKDQGGKATIENGQTLCAQHNFIKKNLNATETGKRLLIRLYELAKSQENQEMVEFCREVLEVYAKHNVNGHLEWVP